MNFDYSEYARKMRGCLSPKDVVKQPSLEINHSYFNVKKSEYWTPEEVGKLAGAVEQYKEDYKQINKDVYNGTVRWGLCRKWWRRFRSGRRC